LARLLAAALAILAGGVAALPHVSTLAHVLTWATAMGLGGGLARLQGDGAAGSQLPGSRQRMRGRGLLHLLQR
jgi:hypothetical protein